MAAPCCWTKISEMPMETQSKIARVLQEQSFERVAPNGTQSAKVKVDIRVIASTARDLAGAIAAGRFREDLYYRLAVVPLRVPSLKGTAGGYSGLGQLFSGPGRRRLPGCRRGLWPRTPSRHCRRMTGRATSASFAT